MQIIALDSGLTRIGVIDIGKSLIWTDRYYTFGDFEFVLFVSSEILTILSQSAYFILEESEHVMILESLEIKYEVETGKFLKVKGRSLETILERRIVWETTVCSGNFQDSILALLEENAVDATDPDRNILSLELIPSTDEAVTLLTIDAQFSGETLYKVVSELCISKGIGFKITLSETNTFQFQFYSGKDRSHGQFENAYVVFSEEDESLLNSSYFASSEYVKTVVKVIGENDLVGIIEFPPINNTDLNRRELFIDGTSISQGDLTDEEYILKLEERGIEELAKSIFIQSFNGEINSNSTDLVYRVDFSIGDVVEVLDEYGHEGALRVTEVIHCQDLSGLKVYPTFSNY